MRRYLVCLAAVVLLGACADASGPGGGNAIIWLEWPAGATPSLPGTARLVYNEQVGCDDIALSTKADFPDLFIDAIDQTGLGGPCPLMTPVRQVDTVIALPQLEMMDNFGGTYTMRAGLVQHGFRDPVGVIRVSLQEPDTTLQVAGMTTLTVDSAGCTIMTSYRGEPYGVTNPPVLGAGWREAFVTGAVVTTGPAACGQRRLIELTSVDLTAPR